MVVARKPEQELEAVTDDFKKKVRERLAADGRGSHSRLAKEIGISTGQLTELLSDDSKVSRYVAPINRHFGWLSVDREEIAYLVEGIGTDALEMLRVVKAMSPEQRRAWLLMMTGKSPTRQ